MKSIIHMKANLWLPLENYWLEAHKTRIEYKVPTNKRDSYLSNRTTSPLLALSRVLFIADFHAKGNEPPWSQKSDLSTARLNGQINQHYTIEYINSQKFEFFFPYYREKKKYFSTISPYKSLFWVRIHIVGLNLNESFGKSSVRNRKSKLTRMDCLDLFLYFI